ncbi:MAG: AEC family transporter [Termitinemataceae bacterium]|nr:MAG: AEC family transporter [Termitinemataceae bacterium]
MDVLRFSFNAVSPLFFVIFLGWFIRRRGLVHENEISFLNTLCFKYLLPVYIFSSVQNVDLSHEFNMRMFVVFFADITIILLLSMVIFRIAIKDEEKRCIYIVNSYRSNNLIYALPLAVNLFGEAGLKSAAMLVPFTIISFNLYSVIVMVHYAGKRDKTKNKDAAAKGELKKTLMEIIKNPLIIGSFTGVLIGLSGLKLPVFFTKGLNSIGIMASPLSLLMLGTQIDLSSLKTDVKHSVFSCLVRLVICPLLTTPAFIMLGFRGPDLSTLAIASAAPCAIATFIMSRNYRIAPQFAAQTVYLSTALSMITIFILISVLRALNFM